LSGGHALVVLAGRSAQVALCDGVNLRTGGSMYHSMTIWKRVGRMRLFVVGALIAGLVLGASFAPQAYAAGGSTIYALTNSNDLLRLDSAAPGTILSTVGISGLQPGENLLGIDFRPASGQLYALGSTSRLYTIDLGSGAATQVGAGPFAPALNGTSFGFDFNPVVDRVRVVSDADQNLRLNPSTGALAGADSQLTYAAGDPNSGANPNLVGLAYNNNAAGVTITTLYGIDSNLDILAIQNPPNNGTLNTIGPLGFDTSGEVGFDIATSGTGFASLQIGGLTGLFTIDLATGAATSVGSIGTGATAIRDIAVAPQSTVYLPLILKQ
jgi:hypothetical protein